VHLPDKEANEIVKIRKKKERKKKTSRYTEKATGRGRKRERYFN